MQDALPYEPLSYDAWSLTPEASRVTDPVEKIRAYDDNVRKELFAQGLYDGEAEAQIAAAGSEQASSLGLEGYDSPRSIDPRILQREAVQAKDNDAWDALQRGDIDPARASDLTKNAVRHGRLPFATYADADGNVGLEVDPELGALNSDEILEYAKNVPGFDYRALPAVKDQLTRVPGLNYTKAQQRQAQVFDRFLVDTGKTDGRIAGQMELAQEAYNRGDMEEYKTHLDGLDASLNVLDKGEEFSAETKRRLVDDLIKRAADPVDYDPANPAASVQYLSSGEVLLPYQTLLNKETFDATLNSLKDLPPEQRKNAEDSRGPRLQALAPLFVETMGADPDALDFYQKEKAAGKEDVDIVESWFGKKENYDKLSNRLRSTGMALKDAIVGIPLGVAALAGDEGSRDAMIRMSQDRAKNERLASLFGDKYGLGQTLLDTAPQVAADILITRGASTAARMTAQGGARALLRQTLSEGTRAGATSLIRSGGPVASVIRGLADDATINMGSLAATTFARSAGSQYANVYSALSDDKNPDGSPKYSDEEKRRISLGAGVLSGLATAGITTAFSALGAGGVEDLATGRLSAGLLKKSFGLTDEAVGEGVRTAARAVLGGAVSEFSEESIDQLVGDMISKFSTDEDFRLGPALKDALEAGLVGGIFGAGSGAIENQLERRMARPEPTLADIGLPLTDAAISETEALPFPAAVNAEAEALPFAPARNADAEAIPFPDAVNADAEALPFTPGVNTEPEPAIEPVPVAEEPFDVEAELELSEGTQPAPAALEPVPETGIDQLAEPAPEVVESNDASFAAAVPEGTFAKPIHKQIFENLVEQGSVPELNSLKGVLKQTGFGGTKYANSFISTLRRAVESRYPIVSVPESGSLKTVKSLTGQDVKAPGGKLLSVPVSENGTGAWTNDPAITAHQLNAGLKVRGTRGETTNPRIKVSANGFVTQVEMPDGQIIQGKGDWNRAGVATKEYVSHRNDPAFAVAVYALPEASLAGSNKIPGGPEMTPQTTENDVLAWYFPDRIAGTIERSVPEDFSGTDRDAVLASVQAAFQKDLREWSLATSEPAVIDEAVAAIPTEQLVILTPATERGKDARAAYKKYLAKRLDKVWSREGRPVAPATFVLQEVKGMTEGKKRRAAVQTVADTDTETGESKLERAAARNGFEPGAVEMETLSAGMAAGLQAIPGAGVRTPVEVLGILVETVKKDKKVASLFRRALIETSVHKGTPQAVSVAANIQSLTAEELISEVANTVLHNPNMRSFLNAGRGSAELKDALASLAYGVNQMTDAQVAAARENNALAFADLELGSGLRFALEKVSRQARFPRRYRAVARVILASDLVDQLNLSVVDRPAEAYAGQYITSTRTVVLNMASTNGRGLLDVLSHELLHAATSAVIEDPKTASAKKLRDQMEQLRATMADVVPDSMAYAVSDLHEFLTHGVTDPAFQRLTQQTMDRGKSVWQRFIDAIARFFGTNMNPTFVDQLFSFVDMGVAHSAVFGYPVDRAGARASQGRAEIPMREVSDIQPAAFESVDQHLAEFLPEGFAYEYADAPEGRELAFSQRSKPGVITVNRERIAQLVDGVDPANAKALISKVVKHEAAHHTVFSTYSDEEIGEIAASMPVAEIAGMAQRYYGAAGLSREEAAKRFETESAEGLVDGNAIVEEYLRSLLEKATSGATTEEALAFYRSNPGFIDRALRYLGDVLKQLWSRIAGPEDIHTRVAVSRLMREHRRIQDGGKPRAAIHFDRSDPSRDERRMAALAIEDPKAPPAGAVIEQMEVSTFNSKDPFKAGTWWSRMFKYRSGDGRPAQLAAERHFQNNALVNLIEKQTKMMDSARASELPDPTVLQAAAGSTKPYITDEQRDFIQQEFDLAMNAAQAIADLDEQQEVIAEALKAKTANEMAARVETSRLAKEAQARAFEVLEETAPKTLQAVKDLRGTIDSLSKLLAKWMPDGDLKVIVGDLGQGIYLTRSYLIHHKDGNPLDIFDDPALEEAVIAAEKMFTDDFVDVRSGEIIEEMLEGDRVVSLDEARALAYEEAADKSIGRAMLENLLLRHGSKAFFQGGDSSFRIDLERYRRRTDVPEVLRRVLEEETDPLNNLARTAFNVTYLATNTRFVHQQAALGKQTGSLITEAQFRGFKELMQETDDKAFVAGATNLGWARGNERLGYTEASPGIFLPDWLIKAHADRNLLALDGYRKIAVSTLKYGAGELDGLYAEPTLATWFEHEFSNPPMSKAEDEQFVRKAGDIFAKATGMSLGVATLGSLGFYTRNFVGSVFFWLGQGISPFSGNVARALDPAFKVATKNPDAYITKMTALGIAHDDLRINTLKDLFKQLSNQPGESFLHKVAATLGGKKGEEFFDMAKSGVGKLADWASAIDTFTKIVAFETEMDVLRRAHAVESEVPPSDEEVRRMEADAAMKVRRTFQARSMVPPVIESLTASSFGRLLAPFLRFRSDVFRITADTWVLAKEEMSSTNPVIRQRGIRRRSGQVGLLTLSATMAPLFNALVSGLDDEEQDALRSALPKYLRSNSIFYAIDDEKNVTSLDITYLNPFSMLTDPFARMEGAISRGEPGEVVEEGAKWIVSMVLEDQIAAGALLEVRNNLDADGKKIYLDSDDTTDKIAKMSTHLMGSAYTPQLFKASDRAFDAWKNGTSESVGLFETPLGHILGNAAPARPRSYSAKDLADRSFRGLAQTQREVRMGAGRLKSRQILGTDEVEDVVGDWYEGMTAVYEDAGTRIRGFEGVGLSKAEVAKSMTDSGFSRDRARGLVFSGRATAPVVTPALKRDILQAGDRASGNKTGGVERLKMISEELRKRPRSIVIEP